MHALAWAYLDGRNATPGDTNPYAGQGLAARQWRRGYQKMMRDVYESSVSYRKFIEAQRGE